MIIRFLALLTVCSLSACNGAERETQSTPPSFGIAAQDIRSGYDFLTPQSQALQTDDFANPGSLWVEAGQDLFTQDHGSSEACASCHTDPQTEFKSVGARYPAIDEQSGRLVNLEGRINLCRTRYQDQPALAYESEDLLSLTTFVRAQSKGQRMNYAIPPDLQPHFAAGEAYFLTRRGQLNLSCQQCHDQNWGRKLRGDTVSQGHINGFPTYRNDWQTLGSSHRRFADCDRGVRAEPLPLGAQTYVDLEVYLMARGSGLPIETPSIRR